jgi:hypothetical protein
MTPAEDARAQSANAPSDVTGPIDGGPRSVFFQTQGVGTSTPLVVSSGHLAIEITDQGLFVEQQVRLVNFSKVTRRLDGPTSMVRLPQGYRALEAMVAEPTGDKRVAEVAAQGLEVSGTLAPGSMVMAWRFQLPLTGTESRFTVTLPWEAVTFRVFAHALPGIELSVQQMPKARMRTEQGYRLLVTELTRKPGDPSFRTIAVRITGIRSPNPLPWVTLGLSILLIAVGAVIAIRTKLRTIAR